MNKRVYLANANKFDHIRRVNTLLGLFVPALVTPLEFLEKKMKEDEGIRAVREVRKTISAEFGNDPQRLVEHYLAEQEKYRSRLLRPKAARRGGGRTRSARR